MFQKYQKILFSSFIVVFLSACGGVTPVVSTQELSVDKKLPTVALTPKGVVTDMRQVAFEWKPLKDTMIDGIKIYRKELDANKTYLAATVENKYKTHYVDLHVQPQHSYRYELRTYKGDKVSSALVLPKVKTKPVLNSVAWIYAINGLPRMAKVLWRPHKNERVSSYIVERRTVDDEDWQKIATLKGRLQAEYIDKDLKDKFTYRYRIRAKTFDGIISVPSEVVKVITKPLPPVVTGLSATTSLPKAIELHWDKSNYKDFERYYLYRSKEKDGHYTLIAKLYNNHFTDKIDQDGAKYFYKVTQKDIDELESPANIVVMGSTLPKPFPPTIEEAKQNQNKIVVRWFKIDPRSVSYIVKREEKTGLFDTKTKEFKTASKVFIDADIIPNATYIYEVYAVDKFGIVSKPSQSVEVEVGELEMKPKPVQTTLSTKEVKKTATSPVVVSHPVKEQQPVEVISIDTINVEEE
ncbi:MAG: fibronectin type III domain-containing protein [Epsilonproteobacteria bacterium]|nr:fibronectin type III domain-containing protein [Campylobacterota bacterium]